MYIKIFFFWMFDTLIFVCFSMYICVVLHILLIAVFYLSSVCVRDSPVHSISLMFIIHNRLFSYSLFRLLFKFFFSLLFIYICLSFHFATKNNRGKQQIIQRFSFFNLTLDFNLLIKYANEFYAEISIL